MIGKMGLMNLPLPPFPSTPVLYYVLEQSKGLGLGDSKWTRKEEREREGRYVRARIG